MRMGMGMGKPAVVGPKRLQMGPQRHGSTALHSRGKMGICRILLQP
jgi:hypothetical protein